MKILHLALTPLAGSPIRIARALSKLNGISARLVVLNPDIYGPRVFSGDLVWEKDREEALELLAEADILHLHHWMDLHENPFGIDLSSFVEKGKKVIRQYHSTPYFIADKDLALARKIIDDPLPQLVNSQHPERYYPRAKLVPNIVPIWDDEYLPPPNKSENLSVFFSPSVTHSAWYTDDVRRRWDTKGAPETQKALKKLHRRIPEFSSLIRHNVPHEQCLRERRHSHVSIDDLVTGSYHLSSLEGLSQGVPTLSWLDQRTMYILRELTGADDLPWINCHLSDLPGVLTSLLNDRSLLEEIGQHSRSWMEKYWDELQMAEHFVRAYEDLFNAPEVYEQSRFELNNKKAFWFVQGRDDQIWSQRREDNSRCFGLFK